MADAMVTRPTVHERSTTVEELRRFFRDDHVHMALLVDGRTLVGMVERADLASALDGETRAEAIATLEGRTIGPGAALHETFDAMTQAGRRRLAVTGDDATLLGLLCLKASALGFCSDDDVRRRRCADVPAR